jgi:hypothetical protein
MANMTLRSWSIDALYSATCVYDGSNRMYGYKLPKAVEKAA